MISQCSLSVSKVAYFLEFHVLVVLQLIQNLCFSRHVLFLMDQQTMKYESYFIFHVLCSNMDIYA